MTEETEEREAGYKMRSVDLESLFPVLRQITFIYCKGLSRKTD